MRKQFRTALDLLENGDAEGLRRQLRTHPELVHEQVRFHDGGYFATPTLLQFIAENPVRRGTLPANIEEMTSVILERRPAGSDETLVLVASGRVPRECGVQVALIDLLSDYGASADAALPAALVHGEFEAVKALLRRGARFDLMVASGLGCLSDVQRLHPLADNLGRHRALALAAQFGHLEIVRWMLDAGEDANRFNPDGFHAHSTPLHQAVAFGHKAVVRLLVERGGRLECKDKLWQGTPADWAQHEGRTEIENYLRSLQDKG